MRTTSFKSDGIIVVVLDCGKDGPTVDANSAGSLSNKEGPPASILILQVPKNEVSRFAHEAEKFYGAPRTILVGARIYDLNYYFAYYRVGLFNHVRFGLLPHRQR